MKKFSSAAVLLLLLASTSVRSATDVPPADVVPFAGLPPQKAADAATMPPGFKMDVFAAEPDVRQPIAFCLDHRGRVWVAEGFTYPKRKGNPPKIERSANDDPTKAGPDQLKDIFGGADRILIFEDTNGDHKFDKTTVFLDHLNLVSGLEVGFGGVWIGAAPYLMFVPVNDWNAPKPAGEPQVLLDGWNYTDDTHEVLNSFTWGPDGWLYGCHGVFCRSHVGKPGASTKERQWMDAGVWRFHPVKHTFEVFTEGGSNPWGIDFDENGQLWAEMCVIPHLWHMIQGARLERQGGEHFAVGPYETALYGKPTGKPVHPYIYEDIKTHGDHVHWAGKAGPHAANARSDSVGGGHAHAGMMCYLGASWPDEYRGKLIIGNIHGQRMNMDIPERSGSGYVGRHGKDFLNFNDSWSQTLNQRYDQDGSVYIIDWYDANQCHHTREDGHDRSNGRIYKIVYQNQKVSSVDVAKMSDEDLVKQVPSRNEFVSRQARLQLQYRAAQNKLAPAALEGLRKTLADSSSSPARLRALWALHLVGGLDAPTAIANLKSSDEWVRAWTIQLAFDSRENVQRLLTEIREKDLKADPDLEKLAESDPSALVRLFIASGAQRIEDEGFRARLVKNLLRHKEDASDHNLPLMAWFAMEPLVAGNPREALDESSESDLPNLLNFSTRRIASLNTPEARNLIAEKLSSTTDDSKQLQILTGLAAALKGQRNVLMPEGWAAIETRLASSANPAVRALVQTVSLTFGSQKALAALRALVSDTSAPAVARRGALDSLVSVKDSQLPVTLQPLLKEPELRGPALRALAGYNDPSIPTTILAVYQSFDAVQKRDALNTLASRPAYAKPLLTAVSENKIPAKDLTADVVRQLRNLKDPGIQTEVAKIYGSVREMSADKKAEIEKYKRIYASGGSQPGNASPGRVVFNKTCAQCHTLFDSGGKVGPDITGANRADLNYLLENILDPNAVIPNEYRTTEIETKDGRSIVGIAKQHDDNKIVIQTANELLTLPRNEIASQKLTELSMMPEGLLAPLSNQEIRDLLYYLGRVGQVPLPAQTAAK
ncbi:MAG TPA: PVC-type heme-binding CxxCH protein [Candidatus Saccharimonadales bacterium]|nr:PVC-type heme-binding CxxCH protein [Candidatus Saccharimonadales bacterium]